MLEAIDYYTSKDCITELKSPKGITQQLLLSKNLYDYLNKIRDILPTQSSGRPQSSTPQQPSQQGIQIGSFVSNNRGTSSTSKNEDVSSTTNESTNQIKEKIQSVQKEQINIQEDNTQQQINHPTQISPPLGALSTYNPIISTQKSPPLGALSTYNPIISTTLPPQSTVPKTNTRQQLGSSRIPESGPVPKNSGIMEFNNSLLNTIQNTRQIQQQFRENTGNA